jgi:hypothetical protein
MNCAPAEGSAGTILIPSPFEDRPMSPFLAFKQQINAIQVTPELLGEVMLVYTTMPAAEQTFEGRAQRVVALLTERKAENAGMLAMAVTVRLMALDVALADDGIRHWTLPGDQPERTYVHASVLRAACKEAVLESPQGQPMFDPERFRERVLQCAAAAGST